MNWKNILYYKDGKLFRHESNNGKFEVGWVNSSGYMQFEYRNKITWSTALFGSCSMVT